jgi:hypothetical protein
MFRGSLKLIPPLASSVKAPNRTRHLQLNLPCHRVFPIHIYSIIGCDPSHILLRHDSGLKTPPPTNISRCRELWEGRCLRDNIIGCPNKSYTHILAWRPSACLGSLVCSFSRCPRSPQVLVSRSATYIRCLP